MTFAEIIARTPTEVTPETIETIMQLYSPAHAAGDYSAPVVSRDIVYGPDDRHRLDLHTPDSAHVPMPLLLFVHGGGFIAGDKYTEGTPITTTSAVGLFATVSSQQR